VTFKGEASFLDKALEFIDAIDLNQSKIKREEGTLFFCGGTIDKGASKPKSMREAILRTLPSRDFFSGSRIILAELAVSKLSSSKFKTLLDLEESIAALVDRVLLVVEGPGSICELGAFVKTKEIASKLLVLLASNHNNAKSFIKVGALDYFEFEHGSKNTCSFDWDDFTTHVEVKRTILDDMIKYLIAELADFKKKSKFNEEKLGDKIYLTLSICHILRGGKISEIRRCIEQFGFTDTESEIQKHLSALEICGFITVKDHGKLKYYVPRARDMPLSVRFKKHVAPSQKNSIRWLADISGMIAKSEPARIDIFQEYQNAK
jgi:hypothetical protein